MKPFNYCTILEYENYVVQLEDAIARYCRLHYDGWEVNYSRYTRDKVYVRLIERYYKHAVELEEYTAEITWEELEKYR